MKKIRELELDLEKSFSKALPDAILTVPNHFSPMAHRLKSMRRKDATAGCSNKA
ncbi:MAG: hypothetical protein KDK40_01795 [Chlamydiia bacterium]|nr:hypothetical protein [Chlamydiia bacterium]